MLFVIHSCSTYADNDKVQTRPHAREVPPQSKCNPLEQHLYGEEDCENHVDNLEDEDELLVVLEVDVLEAQGKTEGRKRDTQNDDKTDIMAAPTRMYVSPFHFNILIRFLKVDVLV